MITCIIIGVLAVFAIGSFIVLYVATIDFDYTPPEPDIENEELL